MCDFFPERANVRKLEYPTLPRLSVFCFRGVPECSGVPGVPGFSTCPEE